jgi:hypothetical protein
MSDFLFDMPREPNEPDQTPPLSHRDDPETSRDAAEQLKRSGRLATQQQAVLGCLT